MTTKPTRTLGDAVDEMRAVLRGDRSPPTRPRARPAPTALSVLTATNRRLLGLILEARPDSVSDLAALAGMSQGNVSRALQDLAQVGHVRFVRSGRSVRPELVHREVRLDIVTGTARPLHDTDAVKPAAE